MRPVDKGACPVDADGADIVFASYGDARPFLLDKLGRYCSYCEMRLTHHVAVEHVRPKSLHKDLERSWDNFLLACGNCNSCKGNDDVCLDDYLWPDRDDTHLALRYSRGGLVEPADGAETERRNQAQSIISLVGLDKEPATPADLASDDRWNSRRETWDIATRDRERYLGNPSEDFLESLVEKARAQGHWSIWMTVFHDRPEIRSRLIDDAPGTSKNCFTNDGIAQSRTVAVDTDDGGIS